MSKDSPSLALQRDESSKDVRKTPEMKLFKLLPFILTLVYSISLLQWEREI